MAVDVTGLAAAMRLGDGVTAPEEPINGILTRLLGVSDAFINLIGPGAPSVVKDEIRVRFASYLYDMPSAPQRDRYSNAWLNSGAAGLLSRWVVRRVAGNGVESPPGFSAPVTATFQGMAGIFTDTGLDVPAATGPTFAYLLLVQDGVVRPVQVIPLAVLRRGGVAIGETADDDSLAADDAGNILYAARDSAGYEVTLWTG